MTSGGSTALWKPSAAILTMRPSAAAAMRIATARNQALDEVRRELSQQLRRLPDDDGAKMSKAPDRRC